MKTKSKKLSPKHRAFVKQYLIDKNAARAYRAVYGEAKGAKESASRLLTNANVAEAVEKGLAALESKLDITAERVLKNIAAIANMTRKDAAHANIIKANELLGKHLKLFDGEGNQTNVTVITANETEVKAARAKILKDV